MRSEGKRAYRDISDLKSRDKISSVHFSGIKHVDISGKILDLLVEVVFLYKVAVQEGQEASKLRVLPNRAHFSVFWSDNDKKKCLNKLK